tara:strand:+ start:78551 stop:79525 length:975 start_codon:yes stop_codon:yes gene_type:complete
VSKKKSQYQNEPPHVYDNEIDLLELWSILWQGKWIISVMTLFFAVASVIYALSLPDIYRSEVLLSPAEQENSSNVSLSGQLGGLASLAGINIGESSATSNKTKALATLRSRVFLYDFFKDHNITVPLMASRPSGRSGDVEIDPEIYDEQNLRWVREVQPPMQPEPTNWEVYNTFIDILDIVEDPATGLITVAIEWYDQQKIKEWLSWLIADLNEEMRLNDTLEASRAINYLTEQLGTTQLVEMRNMFYTLIEQQTRTIMLADAREGYAFEIIDPPIIPERRSAPSRSIICIVITFLGGVFSVIFVFIYQIVKINKLKNKESILK